MFRTFPISTCLLFLLLPMIGIGGLRAAPITPAASRPDFPTGLAEIELRGNGQVILDGDLDADASDGTDFGSIHVCNGSVVRSFVIHNVGTETLLLSGLAITGAGVVSASALPGSIAPGQSHTFTLTFDPAAVGLLQATVTISSNDVDEASFEFGIECIGLADVTPPTAQCQPATVFLNNSGTATLTPAQINNNSSDNCGIANLAVSKSTFSCQDFTVLVTLTVTDSSGNTSTCSAVVTVTDNIPPVVNCPATRTEYVDFQGIVTLDVTHYNLGTTDNCGSLNPNYSLLPSQLFCGNGGTPYTTTVTLTIADSLSNFASCVTTVTVIDGIPPLFYVCPTGNVTLNASGTGTAPPPPWSINIYDNCGLASVVFGPTSYTCANIGINPAIAIATDLSGNVSTCSTTVNVTEAVLPTAICQSAVLYLGAGGTATLMASSVDGGSSDNCGATTLAVTPSAFNCSQLGNRPVTLTVTDQAGNSSTCSTTVTVLDTVSPLLSCPLVHVQLGPQGTATLSAASLVQAATDNCGISSLVASQTTFTCADSAGTAVTVTAQDASGNGQTCTFTVIADIQPFSAALNAASGACGYQVSCAGATDGTATAVANGGCPPYAYAWSNGATSASVTGLGAGIYSVTVADGTGAMASQTITLTAPSPISLQVLSMTPACTGTSAGQLAVAAVGGDTCRPYGYQWSNGASGPSLNGVPPGNYDVTVTNGAACSQVFQASVVALPLPVPVVTQVGNTLQASPGYVGYQWYQGTIALPGETQMVYTSPVGGGLFRVEVIDSNGCAGFSAYFSFQPVSIRQGDSRLEEMMLYPNPSDGDFQFLVVSAIEEPVTVTLTSLCGKQLGRWEMPWLRGGEVFGSAHLAAGVYLVELYCTDGSRKVFQLLRE